jgi:hypothetical protein
MSRNDAYRDRHYETILPGAARARGRILDKYKEQRMEKTQ